MPCANKHQSPGSPVLGIVPSVDLRTHLRQWYPTATLPGSISVHSHQGRNAVPMEEKTPLTNVFSDMPCVLTWMGYTSAIKANTHVIMGRCIVDGESGDGREGWVEAYDCLSPRLAFVCLSHFDSARLPFGASSFRSSRVYYMD